MLKPGHFDSNQREPCTYSSVLSALAEARLADTVDTVTGWTTGLSRAWTIRLIEDVGPWPNTAMDRLGKLLGKAVISIPPVYRGEARRYLVL